MSLAKKESSSTSTSLSQSSKNNPKDNFTSPCILLKNVFDPKEESGTEWPKEIEEDVVSECTKFGQVLHSRVDPNSEGLVYLKFELVEHAKAAIKELNGRWFGKRQISAELFPYNQYAKKFLTSEY